jgi:hypothetical protein
MSFDRMAGTGDRGRAYGDAAAAASPGKRTLTESLAVSDQRGAWVDARGGASGAGIVDNRPGIDGGAAGAVDAGGVPTTGPSPAPGPAPAPAVPTPIAVRNGPAHAPIDTPDRIGMAIAITITSSTGRDADMARIQDAEQVALSSNHTGSFSAMPPTPSSQSGFMAGHPIPDDRHEAPRAMILDYADNKGGNGSFEKAQLDIYTDAAAGVTAPRAIPHSGYLIKRIITKGPGTRVVFRTEKRPAAVSVNGFSTEAGPSGAQGDDVIARA